MNDLNYVLLAGNLVMDPVIRKVNEDTSLCQFTIGVNRSYYDRKLEKWISSASFVPIETWGGLADACAKYLTKGRGIRVVGRISHSTWKDKGGNLHDSFHIVSEHVEFQPVKKPEEPDVLVADENDRNLDGNTGEVEPVGIVSEDIPEDTEN